MMMRARGYQIDSFRSGTEFLMMRGQHGGDCLLIDYKMPRVDGLEVMRRMRALNDETPAIMITGYYSATLRDKAITAGYADILEKPVAPNAVIDAVTRLIS